MPPDLTPVRGMRLVVKPHRRASSRRARLGRILGAVLLLGLIGGVLATAAIATDTFGAGEKWEHLVARIELWLFPPPDRNTLPTVAVTPRPASPAPIAAASSGPPASGSPAPSATPVPRVPVSFDTVKDHEAVFSHELHKDWCAPAGVEMVLAIHRVGVHGDDRQRELAARIGEWESRRDSLNGDWGPAAMALALDAYGVPGYEVRAYDTRADALRDAARAIKTTGAPAILLAWRGAHTWVMTGYKADADPAVFDDATIHGAYILDPWYPWISSIWGKSDPPGTFQDDAEMVRNFLPWKRPEGRYPDRDGKFIVVIPTVPLRPAA
jgi:hypothetical protein